MIIRNHVNKICNTFCTKSSAEKSYTHTVLLPKTKLPLRLEGKKLVDRDKLLSSSLQFTELYQWQRNHLEGNEFTLHDGPPYANGVPHMGHAINKILKDVILRHKILQGNKVHYIPGWDCHGLPIELKATTNNKALDSVKIRQKARAFASETIVKQKEAFLSWGVTGDWDNAYATYHPAYIKNQIQQFYKLFQKQLIYRDVKPVYWSPSTRTALAEAELEYNPVHKSKAVTVKVKLNSIPSVINVQEPIYALIWTTTPWTLPSNQVICYNSNLSYSIVKNIKNNELYICATNLISEISSKLGSDLRLIQSVDGASLKDVTYVHPIYKNKILCFLPALHVIDLKGTGLVHTAPAHGPDDYLVALENNIDVLNIVNDAGEFTSEAGPDLNGAFVLTDGIEIVLKLLGNDLVHVEDYIHSYPYDWRTKKPVILRASKQWFIDTKSIKQKALELLENVKIMPDTQNAVYRHHFKTQLQKRPYWCISRQRSWGVPLPMFYLKDTDDYIITEDTINTICKFIDKGGCDFWWNLSVKDILKEIPSLKDHLNSDNIIKGEDILDIWFDSGLSWSSVLPDKQVADMYLEGVDQFTGWFQSSLLTSTALRNKAPYKAIYIHGFAVDADGKKMSKSLGNVVNPQDIILGTKHNKAYGIDSLRWWVVCHENQDSTAKVSTTALQASNDEVQKLRSVLRFAIAALHDYRNVNINYKDLKLIDKYMLHLLACYQKEVQKYLENYQYHKLKALVINLLTNSVSALYYNSIKDRLYCDPENSSNRKSAQYVLSAIFLIVARSIAAIVPHLAEELYAHFSLKEADSFFKTTEPNIPQEWYSEDVLKMMNYILDFKKHINKLIGAVGMDKHIVMFMNKNQFKNLKEYVGEDSLSMDIADILQVASVEIVEDEGINTEEYKFNIIKSNRNICPRCRKFLSNNMDTLCYRCNVVVGDIKVGAVN
ncbi:soleucyl-trna synthetase [Holotrichia oblita]|uniref:Soleucyl-trna synthetase n=1 Tax=Holotrichia oblita TaxID=644536 RepID=A0ACB9TUF3_HOLOL|nr:soleucyl-trna synthetase [Holotrichia oblita]